MPQNFACIRSPCLCCLLCVCVCVSLSRSSSSFCFSCVFVCGFVYVVHARETRRLSVHRWPRSVAAHCENAELTIYTHTRTQSTSTVCTVRMHWNSSLRRCACRFRAHRRRKSPIELHLNAGGVFQMTIIECGACRNRSIRDRMLSVSFRSAAFVRPDIEVMPPDLLYLLCTDAD